MSANKTIKALREERIMHLTEIARLRALAGEQAPIRDVVRDMRLGVLPFKSPAEVAAMIEQFSLKAAAIQAPIHMLFGYESEDAMRAQLVELGVDVKHPEIAEVLAGASLTWHPSLAALERSESMLNTLQRQYLGDPVSQPGIPSVQFMLSRASEQLVGRINIRPDVTLGEVFEAMSRDTYSLTVGFDPNWQSPFMAASGHVHAAPVDLPNGGKHKHEPAPYFGWHDAPEDATHAIRGMPVLWLKLEEGKTAAFWRTYWNDDPAHWHDSGHASELYMATPNVVARPVPEEVWSLDGQNGSWDYPDLASLVREHYGHVCDSEFGGSGGTLAVGSTIYRAIVCKEDPANFLQDAGEVQDFMAERAYDSDAGEWVDNYPEVGDEAKEALENALKPLKAWARRYCQPKFFTVKDITAHELTEEDVRAARLEHSQCSG